MKVEEVMGIVVGGVLSGEVAIGLVTEVKMGSVIGAVVIGCEVEVGGGDLGGEECVPGDLQMFASDSVSSESSSCSPGLDFVFFFDFFCFFAFGGEVSVGVAFLFP